MPTVKETASAFHASKRIAVTGVPRKPQRHGDNTVYKRLRERGSQVFVVNPAEGEVEDGDEDLAVLLCRRTAAMCPAGRADARARSLADLWAGVFAPGASAEALGHPRGCRAQARRVPRPRHPPGLPSLGGERKDVHDRKTQAQTESIVRAFRRCRGGLIGPQHD
jgi:hypothetical protein